MKNLFKDYSRLHLTLAATIIFIGCLALGLVLISDMAYKNLAIKQQKSALQNLLSIKSKDFINELIQHQKELGYVLQSERIFTDSFNNRDQKELRYWLDQEFNRYYATTGLIKLEKLLVYDTDFKLVSLSARGIAMSQHGKPPCASLIRNMSQLPLAEHLRPRSELCLFDNKPLLSTIVSIGSLPPKGYIQIVSDPVYNLTNIEDKLGIELKISTYDNTILHQSRNWPDNSLTEETLLTGTHVVLSNDSSPLLVISGIGDTQTFYNDLQSTAYKVIAATVFIILSALIIALAVLNNSLLPLRKLRSAAIEINKGNFSTVSKEDQNEITEPFNKAVARIEVLTKNLGHEIGQHRIIEEKLNQAIKQAEDNALTAENHRNILRMTLQSVIDGVITTDTLGQVTYINPIAERLTGWSETDAQGNLWIRFSMQWIKSLEKGLVTQQW